MYWFLSNLGKRRRELSLMTCHNSPLCIQTRGTSPQGLCRRHSYNGPVEQTARGLSPGGGKRKQTSTPEEQESRGGVSMCACSFLQIGWHYLKTRAGPCPQRLF